ncbi:Serine/threonine-protein kinase VRK1 [Hypsibius exemplaris]|uniref:non-specific serine/threonine protein kinase n=1 Tax=Hypsibius exemplaris TaxID=2072580 RepID=A0A1W0WMK7_HYPEX|nr:Serine/threonine-protein kinase VRK1 [Hypsibius exemplaris]
MKYLQLTFLLFLSGRARSQNPDATASDFVSGLFTIEQPGSGECFTFAPAENALDEDYVQRQRCRETLPTGTQQEFSVHALLDDGKFTFATRDGKCFSADAQQKGFRRARTWCDKRANYFTTVQTVAVGEEGPRIGGRVGPADILLKQWPSGKCVNSKLDGTINLEVCDATSSRQKWRVCRSDDPEMCLRSLFDKTASYLGRPDAVVRPPTPTASIFAEGKTAILAGSSDIMPPKKVPSTSSGGVQHSGMKAAPVKTAKGYKRPDPLPEGFLVEDRINKRSWRVGERIGQGGFADVYTASDHTSKPVPLATAKNVIKVEPLDNSPLFQEIKFFKAAAKKDTIAAFLVSRKLKGLGMMEYVASGTVEFNDKELRWLVLPRLGQCVQTILDKEGGRFSRQTVVMLAIQLIDILEYIHSQGYAHADIKAGNMMTGFGKTDAGQVYLIDFGLVRRFMVDGKHIEPREEPKAAHDGTLELTSVDAHKGIAPSRRGDMQILGYNLIKWTVGALPWSPTVGEKKEPDANFVKNQKQAYLLNHTEFMRVALPDQPAPKELDSYFKEVKALGYSDKPNYNKLRSFFEAAGKEMKVRKSDLFQAAAPDVAEVGPPPPKKRPAAVASKRVVKAPSATDDEDSGEDEAREVAKKARAAPKKKTSATTIDAQLVKDLSKFPPTVTNSRKKAATSDGPSTSAAVDHSAPSTSGLATALGKLPAGQRRKVKAALEANVDGQLDNEILAKLPPGQRRQLKAAAKSDDEEGDGRNGHHRAPSMTTNSLSTSDGGGSSNGANGRSQRPTRTTKTVRSYCEDHEGDTPASKPKGKKTKKTEL